MAERCPVSAIGRWHGALALCVLPSFKNRARFKTRPFRSVTQAACLMFIWTADPFARAFSLNDIARGLQGQLQLFNALPPDEPTKYGNWSQQLNRIVAGQLPNEPASDQKMLLS
jgi:hypothetical protein